MIYFLDTSALAKRYVAEAGSTAVRSLLRRRQIAVARIAYAELAATLARRYREGALPEATFEAILARLDADFSLLTIVEIKSALVARVPELVRRHPLRGYDAVQLAAALTLHGRGVNVDFWSADGPLVSAAKSEGLRATRL